MKTLLFFASSHNIGLTAGLTEMVLNISRINDLHVLAISGEKEQCNGLFMKLQNHNIDFIKINSLDKHVFSLKLINEMKKTILDFKPDIIHVQTNWQLLLVVIVRFLLKHKVKVKIIYMLHSYRNIYKIMSYIFKSIVDLVLFLLVDKVIVCSTYMRNILVLSKKKTKVIFLGVDNVFFDIKNKLYKKQDQIKIIFPGEFRYGKNQNILIKALKQYILLTNDFNVILYLPGSGDLLENCEALVKNLGLEKNIIFPGYLNRSDILELYKECQFSIIPSNSETFGLCIAEPFVLGMVIFTRKVGIAKDIISNGINGFIFDNENDLAFLMKEYLRNEEVCNNISIKAFNNRNLFRWDKFLQEYNKVINDLAV